MAARYAKLADVNTLLANYVTIGESLIDSRKILVTGSRGFIGRHYSAAFDGLPLQDAGDSVDLLDAPRVAAAIAKRKPDAVIHLAAQSSVAVSINRPRETYEVNFFGTLNLLEALSAADFTGTFLFVSSADIYGSVPDDCLPTRESQPAVPRSPYAVSKVAAEALCYQWSQTAPFRVIMVRPFNQIGPGHDGRFAIPNFARQIVEMRRGLREPVLHTGNIDVSRDFTDVRDSIRALHLLLDSGRNGEAYNICSGHERTIRSVVQELLDVTGVQAEIRVDPARIRAAEQWRMLGDNSKIREHTGWKPEIPFRTTIQDILIDTETQLHV